MMGSISSCIFNKGGLVPRSGLPQDVIYKLDEVEYWVGIKSYSILHDIIKNEEYIMIVTDCDDEIKIKIDDLALTGNI